MRAALAWVITAYRAKKKFRTFVQMVEGAVIVYVLQATAAGFDFSKNGIRSIAAGAAGAMVVAVRNWLLIPGNVPVCPDLADHEEDPPPPPPLIPRSQEIDQ